MIHAFIYLLIGSAIAYFMQSQIRYIAERATKFEPAQVALKITMDAVLSLTWVIGAPVLMALKIYLKRKEDELDS